MDVAIAQGTMATVLGMARPFVPSKSHLDWLQHVRLDASGERLTVHATDLDKALIAHVPADVTAEGVAVLHHAQLAEFVRTLPDGPTFLTSVDEDEHAHIAIEAGGQTHATMLEQDLDQFPQPMLLESPDPDEATKPPVETVIQPDVLAAAIRRVLPATAKDDARPVLAGALLSFDGEHATFAAADGYRLAVQQSVLTDPVSEPVTAIVPHTTLDAVGRLIAKAEQPVKVRVDATQFKIRFEVAVDGIEYSVTAQTIQGQFPAYEKLIPSDSEWDVTVDAGAMDRTLGSAHVYARLGQTCVRLSIEKPGEDSVYNAKTAAVMRMSAQGAKVGDAKRETVCTEANGLDGDEAGQLAFNPLFLADLLKVVDGALTLSASGPTAPVKFEMPDDPTYVHVVMPMHTVS